MLEVTAQRKTTAGIPQTHEMKVQLWGFDRLTPKAARAALEIAFGQRYDGEVWWTPPAESDKPWDSTYHLTYGYRVYKKTARKVWPNY